MRSCDDIDEQALSYAEIKALCAGDPRIREKMDLDVQVAKLKVLRGDFQNQKYRLEDKLLKTFPEEIQKQKTRIAALQQDSQIAAAHPQDKENFCGMTMNMIQLKNRPFAGKAPTTTQQAEFSIGWRFCPVCGNKLYKKIDGCSGTLQVKCSKCKETLRLDLAFRRR